MWGVAASSFAGGFALAVGISILAFGPESMRAPGWLCVAVGLIIIAFAVARVVVA